MASAAPSSRLRAAGFAMLLLLTGCKTELYSSLQESEANAMIAVLEQHGMGAEKVRAKDGTLTVSVEKSQFGTAVSLLRDNGLPRKKFDNIGDVFKQGGLVASPMQDRARFLYALSQELSSTVSEIDGVLTARVEVVLPDNDIMQRNPTPSSASVFVRYDAKSKVDQLVPQIKMLVANSVEGLTYDKVSVVLVPVTRPAADNYVAAGSPMGAYAGIVVGVVLLAVGGLGYVFRDRVRQMIGQRGVNLPAVWTGRDR